MLQLSFKDVHNTWRERLAAVTHSSLVVVIDFSLFRPLGVCKLSLGSYLLRSVKRLSKIAWLFLLFHTLSSVVPPIFCM